MANAHKCFVATAAYGSEMSPEIIHLTHYRDQVLLKSKGGQVFVKYYYKIGPYFAKVIAESGYLRSFTRTLLKPLIAFAKKKTSD